MFNRKVFLDHKTQVAKLVGHSNEFDYVRDEIAETIADRMTSVTKKLPIFVELSAGRGHTLQRLTENSLGIKEYYMCDPVASLLRLHSDEELGKQRLGLDAIHRVQLDEESDGGTLPIFENSSVDGVICTMYTHWINDLPGVLSGVRRILKPDGVFFGAILGGDSLHELRSSFVLAEQEREGGVSPHVSPFIALRDMGNLIARAGFTIPTIDTEQLTVYYPDALTMMHHLQLMGEGNALIHRRKAISRETMIAAASIYDSLFMTERGIPATFEFIYFICWSPDPSQPKPAKRGSATVSMKDLAKFVGTHVTELHEEGDGTVIEKKQEMDAAASSGTVEGGTIEDETEASDQQNNPLAYARAVKRAQERAQRLAQQGSQAQDADSNNKKDQFLHQ